MTRSFMTVLTILGFAIVLGACGPTTTPVAPTPDTTASPSPTITPTADPTVAPTATPTTSP